MRRLKQTRLCEVMARAEERRGEGTGEWDHYVNHNLPS